MKKSLVLAMAMALGVTASAYAANPFSDVPAGHWAYDSIDKLAAAGVIDGMGDGTYQGDKTMTRYEMAQIVAKAMAKGANVDKLAAEFADELDNLGVRVANLEKKADNVTITGTVRFRYSQSELKNWVAKDDDGKVVPVSKKKAHTGDLRSRLYITGKVNEDWTYHSMIQNTQTMTEDGKGKGEETTEFKEAYMTGKIGGVAVTAGRYNEWIADGNVIDLRSDAIKLSYGSKYQVTAYMGRANEAADGFLGNKGKYYGGEVATNLGKVNVTAGYVVTKDWGKDIDKDIKAGQEIFHLTGKYNVGDLALAATYLHGKYKDDAKDAADYIKAAGLENIDKKNGFVLAADYKGAKASEVGSWGVFAKYFHVPSAACVNNTTDAEQFAIKGLNAGFKGYAAGANYTVAKNMVATFTYYDTKSIAKVGDDKGKGKVMWSELMINF